jgi:hypothetical protein
MDELMNYATAAFEKHKELEIAYGLTKKNKEVTDEEINKEIEKYKSGIKLMIQRASVDNSPTGTIESNRKE